MNKTRWLIAVLGAALFAAYLVLDLGKYLDLAFLKSQQQALEGLYRSNPLAVAGSFFLAYVLLTAASIPGAAVMTLLAGALFGLAWGTLLVSFASSIGATLAFLASRLLFRDVVKARFGSQLAAIDAGLARDGAYFLFALRLVPAFPFFLINLLMGLTGMRSLTFYWVSQLGMLAGTLVYVNAGTQLARVESLAGLASPVLLGSFLLLGVFPLAAHKCVDAMRAHRIYAPWAHRRPRRFERNLVVIGAGSAGLVSAYIAATVKAGVTLVEKHRMGGDCLNTGCVPSKALIRSARIVAQARRGREYGLTSVAVEFSFADIMDRVRRVIAAIEPHDSAERYAALGVECLPGEARIVSPWEVEVRMTGGGTPGGTRRITTRAIVIAAGARPFVPPIPGIDEVGCLTSGTLWDLRELPARLVVLGGGPIGCELAQCFARLGSQVSQVEMLPRLLAREDPDVSALVEARFRAEGIDVLTGHRALRFAVEAGEKVIYAEHDGREKRIVFDVLLCAVGRVANTEGYGLEELGIGINKMRCVESDAFMRTSYPNILVCGDAAGPYQFTHTAAHTAWYAAINGLFGPFYSARADFSVIPWATFTEPEVARVGLNETEATERGIAFEVTRYDLADLDRAIADGEACGMVKVLTVPDSDRILGATIAGEHAGELIGEFVTAMRNRLGLYKLLGTIHIYPTLMEANKNAAGARRRAQVTVGQREFLAVLHAWRRSDGSLLQLVRHLPALVTDRRKAHPAG